MWSAAIFETAIRVAGHSPDEIFFVDDRAENVEGARAAGLDAVTIIWIASKFTEEHRAAVDWLDRITDDGRCDRPASHAW